jgi:hypothetical protein
MERKLISDLSYELVNMAEEGRAVWAAVSTEDPLFYGHHPMMEKLCRRNAERLNAIFDSVGWPDGWAADWLLYHAIWSPNVMRRGLGLLRAAERRREVDPLHVALLEDRILMLDGAVGLDPLAEAIEEIRAKARRCGAQAPADRAARMAATEEWARSVGWRD